MNPNIQPLLEARIYAYDFLRRAFLSEPSLDYLQLLTQEGYLTAFPFGEEEENLSKGIKLVLSYLSSRDVTLNLEFETLHWDYTRLFIGPFKLPAPPWESAYLNKDRLLFQEETHRVRLAYLKYAFLPKLYQQEADDHLGLELDFMYQLAVKALQACQEGQAQDFPDLLRDQQDFLVEHLNRWVPQFSAKVSEHAKTDFYRGMAFILKGFLSLDLKAINELLDIDIPA